MPSGKRAKQQRREAATASRTPPPVRSKGVPRGPRQASPRTLAIAAGVIVLIGLGIGLGVVFSGGSKAPITSTNAPVIGNPLWPGALQGAVEANDLFKGIPESGLTLGKPSARVHMVIFIDVQCPICENYEVNYLPTIVEKYIRTGKVLLILKPWAFISDQSFTGRLAVIAASFQNKAFEYAKVLYDNQGEERSGWLTDPVMQSIAESVNGLKVPQVMTEKASARAKQIAAAVDSLATAWGVGGTPTIFVGRAGSKPQNVLTPAQEAQNLAPDLVITEQALDAALAS